MKQIEQDAPADVFLSADVDWMDYGAKHNLIQTDTRLDLLGNRLVLIAPKDSKNGDVKIALRAVERGERLVEEQETIGTFALSRKRIR